MPQITDEEAKKLSEDVDLADLDNESPENLRALLGRIEQAHAYYFELVQRHQRYLRLAALNMRGLAEVEGYQKDLVAASIAISSLIGERDRILNLLTKVAAPPVPVVVPEGA